MKFSNSDSEFVADFYDDRYNPNNSNYQNCGWGSRKSQIPRFENLFLNITPQNKILDFGAGMGDLAEFLYQGKNDFAYLGVDVSKTLLEAARKKYKRDPNINFCLGDFRSCKREIVRFAPDISVASGVFTLRRPSSKNYDVAKTVLEQLFICTNEVVAANFLTTNVDYINPKNFHYDPEIMLAFGRSLSENVFLYHNHILREFTLQIHK